MKKHHKHIAKHILIICCIFFIFGCYKNNNQTDKETNYPTIFLELKNDFIFWEPDSIFKEKAIIPLETNNESLIAEIKKIEIVNDTLYILDNIQDIIYLFDKSGGYITKIADRGRGAKEYITISDFHIDNNIIYVAASSNRKIMCYNTQGEFLYDFPTEFSPNKITTDSNYLYVYYNFSHNKNYNVSILDKTTHSEYKHYKTYPPQQAGIGYSRDTWTNCSNQVYAAFPYEYNLYRLTPDTCHIIATLDCGSKNMYPAEWKNYSPQQTEDFKKSKGGIMNLAIASDIQDLYVTPSRIWLSFIYKNAMHSVIINRPNGKITYGIPRPSKYHWNIMMQPVLVTEDYIVIPTSSNLVLEYLEKLPPEAPEHTLNLKEENNPCLYFYKFKH